MKRETLRRILKAVLLTVAHVEYRGTEHVPQEGPILIATNHNSRMDSLYLFVNPVRTDITALVADKYLKYPVFNWVLKTAGVVWLDRSEADFGAFRKAAEIIKSGVAMGIAPEGTRSTIGELQEGKPGVALLAVQTNTPIVPVGVTGTDTFFKRLLTLRRPRVTLTFGPVMHLAPLKRETRKEQLQQYTEEIMCRIAALLPERYRGFYKDHPCVKELLEGREKELAL